MKRFYIALLAFCSVMMFAGSCLANFDEPRGPGEHGIEVSEQPAIYYEAYIHDKGWTGRCVEMKAAGDPYGGQSLDAVRIYTDLNPYLDVVYRVHVANGEWSPWVANGATAGAPGHNIDGIEISFTGRAAMFFTVSYKVLSEGPSWENWTKSGETAGDLQHPLQSLRIKIE